MEFNPIANLVEFLVCPSSITKEQAETCIALSKKVIEAFNICGLLAVELFLDKRGNILVNEVAPRPHNSGHHTIEACFVSQFDIHMRSILNWPLLLLLGWNKLESNRIDAEKLDEARRGGC